MLGMNVRTWVGTMNEAGIDCDAGSGRTTFHMECRYAQQPGIRGIQRDAEDATFKRAGIRRACEWRW